MCLSAISSNASGVISLPVKPVPPVVIITSIFSLFVQSFKINTISSLLSLQIFLSINLWLALVILSTRIAPDLSLSIVLVSVTVNKALLTVTDTRTIDNDKSGAILVDKITNANHKLIDRKICKDNKDEIVLILKDWTNNENIDVIITTGGTGLTGRDITPEALEEIADKHIPGFGEVFRTIS